MTQYLNLCNINILELSMSCRPVRGPWQYKVTFNQESPDINSEIFTQLSFKSIGAVGNDIRTRGVFGEKITTKVKTIIFASTQRD